MQDIVEEALQNANGVESETSVNDFDCDKFGTLTCAVIGCGTAGINRIDLIDDADTTAVIGDPSTLNKMVSDTGTQIPVVEHDPPDKHQIVNRSDFESAVIDAVEDPDTVVVTGHLETTASVHLLNTICRQFSMGTTVIVVPSVPQEGLSTDGKAAFLDLTDAAGMTVPYDLTQVGGAAHQEAARNNALEITNSLIVELISDVFDTFRGSMAAPVLRWDATHDQFNNGGVTLFYRGWAHRDDNPEEVVERVASNQVCDGDSQTVTEGFGFVRFGESFTLAEFETLRENTMQLLARERIEDDRWVFCGDSTLNDSEEYRLSCLLAGVDPESLEFM